MHLGHIFLYSTEDYVGINLEIVVGYLVTHPHDAVQ